MLAIVISLSDITIMFYQHTFITMSEVFMIIFHRRLIVVYLIFSTLTTSGCLKAFFSTPPDKTHIIAVPYGSTEQRNNFKFAKIKPGGHVVWGPETGDGAECTITISNVSIDKQVYRRDFTYNKKTMFGKGFIFSGGKIDEPNPYWHNRVGEYVVTLYVNDRRISADRFHIRP